MCDSFAIKHFVGRRVVIVLKIVNVEGLRLFPIGAAHKLGCIVGGILLQLNENITRPSTVIVVPSLVFIAVLGASDVAVGKDLTRVIRSVVFFNKFHHKFLKSWECGNLVNKGVVFTFRIEIEPGNLLDHYTRLVYFLFILFH